MSSANGGLDLRVLRALVERAADSAMARPDSLTRRELLRSLARTTGSTLAAAYGASLLAACGSRGPDAAQDVIRAQAKRNETVERWLFRHTAMDRGAGPLAGAAFPNYHVAPAVPVWNTARDGAWALVVDGLVARPLRLSLADLQRLPRVSQRVNHFCVEGWNAVAVWNGVRVADLARLAGASPDARYVDFRSFDVQNPTAIQADGKRAPSAAAVLPTPDVSPQSGSLLIDLAAERDYHECWDVESAMHPQTLVAYGRDGRQLDPALGAPARLHSPIKLGYKNTKYLTRVVFRRDRTGGFWSDQGYEWYGGT
ncbi:MAG TPA: molybdopterin-dependent oxidoreductase [Gemmatimonadaceae bacterium]|nr:molybdopterin-dependent oxidoreductase [Gemmatimonadaceae bacterium]